jgi:hypothetical protein
MSILDRPRSGPKRGCRSCIPLQDRECAYLSHEGAPATETTGRGCDLS